MVKHMKRGEKPLGDKYLARIQLDRDMGEIFEWVTNLKPSNRAREISVALRLGFSVQKFNGDLPLNRVSDQIANLSSLDLEPSNKSMDHELQTEEPVSATDTKMPHQGRHWWSRNEK